MIDLEYFSLSIVRFAFAKVYDNLVFIKMRGC